MNKRKLGLIFAFTATVISVLWTVANLVNTGTISAEGCALCVINTVILCLSAIDFRRKDWSVDEA